MFYIILGNFLANIMTLILFISIVIWIGQTFLDNTPTGKVLKQGWGITKQVVEVGGDTIVGAVRGVKIISDKAGKITGIF